VSALLNVRYIPGYRRMRRFLDTDSALSCFKWQRIDPSHLLKYSLINYARTKGRLRNHSGDSIAREREVSARFLTSYLLSLLSFFQLLLHTSSSQCPLFFRLLPRFSCLITCSSLQNVLHVKYINQAVQFAHRKITSTYIS